MQLTGVRGLALLMVVGVVALAGVLFVRSAWPAHAGAATPTASNVAMNCEPGQQAVVRQALVGREMQVSINCVSGAQQGVAYVDEYGRPIQTVGPQAYPVAYAQPAGLVRPIAQPTYAAPARARTTAARRTVARDGGRSWQKTALVIGGSTGAGAGIGGIVGGKKGALIGAAIGAGGSSIYEAIKRR